MSKYLKKITISLCAVLAAFAVAEVSLRVAGEMEMAKIRQRLAGRGGAEKPLIAFVGDSNIYGAYVAENETLPERVRDLSGGSVRCLNFGVPGSPSWAVLEQLRRALELKPRAIVARTGINNTWTLPPEKQSALDNLKIYKFLRILLFSPKTPVAGQNGAGIPEAKPGEAAKFEIQRSSRLGENVTLQIERPDSGYLQFDEARARVHADYEEMARLAEEAGAKLIFATYLSGYEGTFQEVTKEMLRMEGVRGAMVADCGAAASRILNITDSVDGGRATFEEAVARRASMLTRDRHPTGAGYRLEARVVGAKLAEAGLLDPAVCALNEMEYIKSLLPHPKLLKTAAKEPAYRLNIQKGDRATLVLGTSGVCLYKEITLPVDFRTLKSQAGIETIFTPNAVSADGQWADFRVPPAVLAKIPGGRALAIGVVERGGEFGAACAFISNTLEIQ